MERRRAFCDYHPFLIFFYFFLLIAITMLCRHPLIIGISLLASICCHASFSSWARAGRSLLITLPILLLCALINPLFSHLGRTVLFFLGRTPFTLESLLYGAVSGAMLFSVLYWFFAYQAAMGEEKFLYLFGRAFAHLSLIITMVFRFLPLFRRRAKEIELANTAMGIPVPTTRRARLARRGREYTALFVWSLESAIDTSHAMVARGYGTHRRSSARDYRFTRRDLLLLCILVLCGGTCIFFFASGIGRYTYYPSMQPFSWNARAIALYASFAILAFLPTMIEGKENLSWRYFLSNI